MKKGIFVFVIFLFSSVCARTEEPTIIDELRNSITKLSLQVTNLQKIIESQKEEIARLRKLCADSGIDITPKKQRKETSKKTNAVAEPFFGVYLGEPLKALRSRIKISKSNYVFADRDYSGRVWSVKNNDPNVKRILVCTFNERIYEIDIEFTDTSWANCDAIKAQLMKDYQTADQTKYEQLLGKNTFEAVINGINIGIELNSYAGSEKNSRLTLTYVHIPLLKEVFAELEKRKAGISAGKYK
jgi:hypothetical protein